MTLHIFIRVVLQSKTHVFQKFLFFKLSTRVLCDQIWISYFFIIINLIIVLLEPCAWKGKVRIAFYPKATLCNCFLPIHTSPNWPAPSLFTIFRVSLGISHSSWAQGLWGAMVLQGLPSLWHKPSADPICSIRKFGKRTRLFRGE